MHIWLFVEFDLKTGGGGGGGGNLRFDEALIERLRACNLKLSE